MVRRLEDRYRIWRHPDSTQERPLVQGYIPAGRYRVAWGTPLCKPEDYRNRDCVKHHKKMIHCCIDEEMQHILGEEGVDGHKFSTLTCIKEDVLYPETVDLRKKEIRKNEQKALSAKVFITELKLKVSRENFHLLDVGSFINHKFVSSPLVLYSHTLFNVTGTDLATRSRN